MNFRWKKLGLLYCPGTNRHPKLATHAANPLAVHLHDDVYRVYFSGRDQNNRSSVGAVDLDIVQGKVMTDHEQPFFEHGPTGSFYADGVSIGNCYTANGKRYMLFMGWQTTGHDHWRGDIGRLRVNNDLSLQLEEQGPFLGSDHHDPISLSYPWVESTGNGYMMWYGSTLTWDAGNGEMAHVINLATSVDGQHWQRRGLCVPYALGVAQAFSRPAVLRTDDGQFHMWFSYRNGTGTTYRIGYAYSADGVQWQLGLEHAGIDLSASGWDSEMIEYPFVFSHRGNHYMLYNGNGFGKTGFGLAILEHAAAH
jgi:hypothetical protein